MPAPDPYSIWIEPVMGGSVLMYYRYFGTGKAGNRKKRVARLCERLSQGDWVCRWCSDPIAIWRRTDARYCRERCRKKAARSRKRNRWVTLSSVTRPILDQRGPKRSH